MSEQVLTITIYFSNFNCISNQHFINSKMLPRESNGQFIFYHYLFLENEYLGSNHKEVIRQYSIHRNKVLIQIFIT